MVARHTAVLVLIKLELFVLGVRPCSLILFFPAEFLVNLNFNLSDHAHERLAIW